MQLRAATVADAAAMAEAHVRAWQTAFRGIVPDERLDALRVERSADRFRGYLAPTESDDQRFILAVSGDTALGFVGFGTTRDEDVDPARVAEVRGLYVHPAHWRRGVGRRLLQAAIDELTADGYDTATLWTLAESEASRAFYEAQGWRTDGVVTPWEDWDGVPLVRYRIGLPQADSRRARDP
ncbi:MAG: GNAT family N-acetyltransferase [Chloroflexi bacterium]|nr:GNAT family N-acetyltransferase [Chloroflexota bacterium]